MEICGEVGINTKLYFNVISFQHSYTCLHIQVLIKRFADFVHDVLASEERVTRMDRMAQSLLDANHSGEWMQLQYV